MNQHSLRWPGLVVGPLFILIAAIAMWPMWHNESINVEDIGYGIAGTLIVGRRCWDRRNLLAAQERDGSGGSTYVGELRRPGRRRTVRPTVTTAAPTI